MRHSGVPPLAGKGKIFRESIAPILKRRRLSQDLDPFLSRRQSLPSDACYLDQFESVDIKDIFRCKKVLKIHGIHTIRMSPKQDITTDSTGGSTPKKNQRLCRHNLE
ncbi:hypothetical protein TSMEX_002681 [Taenia solium]|eukprot:TsM_000265800 transcript=TsM_000265800 gene=TsM_000265800